MENEPITLDQMVSELGGTPAPVTEPDVTPAPVTDAVVETVETPAAETTPVVDAAPVTTPPATDTPPAQPDKAQQTFAAMRVQNKNYKDMLKSIAEVLEVPVGSITDEAVLMAALQTKVIEKQAAASNVPVPVLTELNQLRQSNQESIERQRHSETAIGFQRVQDAYKLTQAELNTFAEELISNGINPLAQSVDLVKQYKTFHHDDLVQKAVQAAVAAEQARAAKANTSSTTPGSKQGAGSGGEPTKVGSVHELNAWLDANLKK